MRQTLAFTAVKLVRPGHPRKLVVRSKSRRVFQEAFSYLGVEHGDVAAVQVVTVEAVLGVGGVSGIIELKKNEAPPSERHQRHRTQTNPCRTVREVRDLNRHKKISALSHHTRRALLHAPANHFFGRLSQTCVTTNTRPFPRSTHVLL